MLKTTGGELLKLGVFPKAVVQEMLERLKEREENIAIGYYKEREEQE